MKPAQCRAARAMLKWRLADLAREAEVNQETVSAFERDVRHPNRNNLRAMREAFERHGIVFTFGGGHGVWRADED